MKKKEIFSLEISPSSRAFRLCRKCEEVINGQVLRMYQIIHGGYRHKIKHCYHLKCFTPGNKYQKVKSGPSLWGNDYNKLSDEHKLEVDEWINNLNKEVAELVAVEKKKIFKKEISRCSAFGR